MHEVLAGLQGVGCIMDDLIVSGKNHAEHLHHLAAVLDILQMHQNQKML